MSAVEVRRAEDDDVPAIAGIHVRSWQAAYRGVLPDELLDGLSASERARSWRQLVGEDDRRRLTLVAERPDGGLTGFCSVATPSRDEDAGEATAEVGALYVDPDHWRQGSGAALLASALEELRNHGWRDAILWVLPENHTALAFYRWSRSGELDDSHRDGNRYRPGPGAVAPGRRAGLGNGHRRGTRDPADPRPGRATSQSPAARLSAR